MHSGEFRTKRLPHIGGLLRQQASQIVDRWETLVADELMGRATPGHRERLRNELPQFIEALGSGLEHSRSPAQDGSHQLLAREHGRQRWQENWQLDDLLRDYRALQVAIIEHLDSQLDPPLGAREAMEVDLWLDHASSIAVGWFVDSQQRELLAAKHDLEQQVVERTAVALDRAERLKALAAMLSQTEQRERQRLAELLHDHIQQLLVAAKLRLGAASRRAPDASLQNDLHAVDQLVDQCIQAARTLSAELSPRVLYDAGLAAGLQWLAKKISQKYSLRVDCEIDERAEPESLDAAIAVFQAARELLLNVVKHAGVDRAQLRLERPADDLVRLVVSDQGSGFDSATLGHSASFGLFHIQERLEAIGGQMQVASSPDAGTRILLEVPR